MSSKPADLAASAGAQDGPRQPQSAAPEIEMRFLLTPEAIDAFKALPVLAAAGPPEARELTNAYFDTPDHLLARAGCSLRIRKTASRRQQTLKVPMRKGAAQKTRLEMERDVTADRPGLSPGEKRNLPPHLRRKFDERKLQTTFTTSYHRLAWKLRRGASIIEATLDQGTIAANEQQLPICEVELELKSGNTSDLLQLAIELCGLALLALGTDGKSERGARLATGKKRKPRPARAVKLKAKSSLAECFHLLAEESLAHYAENHAAFMERPQAEAVHQMRVALRRMRAIVWAFKPVLKPEANAEFVTHASELLDHLSPARTLDVFTDETLPQALAFVGEKKLRQQARAKAREMAANAHAELAQYLRSSAHAEHVLKLKLQLAETLQDLAQDSSGQKPQSMKALAKARLEKQHTRLIEKSKRDFAPESKKFHHLRIGYKKQRYVAEAFGSLFAAKPFARYARQLEKLQSALGTMHDEVVAKVEIEKLANALAAPQLSRQLSKWPSKHLSKGKKKSAALRRKFIASKPFW